MAALAVLAAVGGPPTTATAATARIVSVDPGRPDGPTEASIVITAVDGSKSTLGPHRFHGFPEALTGSPDGRWLAVSSGRDDARRITIVPTDGSAPFALRTVPASVSVASYSDFSWFPDGAELVIGNGIDRRARLGRERFASVALRCSIATRTCGEIAGGEGLAAPLRGGVVTSTSLDDVLPFDSPFGFGDPVSIDARPSRRSRAEQRLLRQARTPLRSRTTVVSTVDGGPGSTTVTSRRSSLVAGVDAAIAVLGGPSGALLVHDRLQVDVSRRGTRLRMRNRPAVRRWTVIAPDGSRRTRPLPHLRIPRAHSTTKPWGRELLAQRAGVVPAATAGGGGWIGTVGLSSRSDSGALVLARIEPRGSTRFVSTGGTLASATVLVRATVGGDPTLGTAQLEIVGYEPATDAAVVTLDWIEGRASTVYDGTDGVIEAEADRPRAHHATVRVPLDGRTAPTVVSQEHEDAAW